MERLAKIVSVLVKRWTAKSPKAARIATDVGLAFGAVGGIVLFLTPFGLVTFPAWVVPTAGFLVALSGKLTTMDDAESFNKAYNKFMDNYQNNNP